MDLKNIVVIGGGVGGTLTANYLASKLKPELRERKIKITLISATDKQLYEPGLLYLIFNKMEESEIIREIKYLLDPDINLVVDTATRVDTSNQVVETEKGSYPYDYLVIATGSKVAPEEIPGLKEGGHWFYNLEGARKLRDALAKFKGGKIVVSVMGVPHKCPVAPIEVSFMLHDFFKHLQMRDQVEILYTYPINKVFLMDSVAELVADLFDQKGIEYKTFFNPIEVDAKNKKIMTLEGEEEQYDLLIAIPPHKGSDLVINSGLADKGGWVPTDRFTLKVEGYDNVYAVGDATNLPVSKAGSVAHFEAEVIAENIAAEIKGLPPTARYYGKTMCFIETSFDEATYIWFDYETPPKPVMPSRFIHWTKIAYNRLYWLTARGIL
jgi:sulfide:quinone oxidoreductase